MDSLITAAARALAAGDTLGALNRVALREDPPALALRGIAMAQLGDFEKAKTLLRRAARAFGHKEALARARCVVAQAEVALASRDLGWNIKALGAARRFLEDNRDPVNAALAQYLEIRRLLLIGRLDEAEQKLETLDPARLSPALRATHELILAGLAMRRLRSGPARDALELARRAASQAGIPALSAEVESAFNLLEAPAARLIVNGESQALVLEQVEALQGSTALIVDACRFEITHSQTSISLARRPVLFTLVRTLAETWPQDASRKLLIDRAFRGKQADESHRARLRVEIGRLRVMLRKIAEVRATTQGFLLAPRTARKVLVIARPFEEQHASLLAFLSDGESWSSSSLALALGTSQRTVQRALDQLSLEGKVEAFGKGRARRWMTPPMPGFTTTLLLPAPLPGD